MLEVNQFGTDFELPQIDHPSIRFSEASQREAVLIFYKYTCGTSRFTMPFLQKIFEAYGDSIYFAAIAQDETEPTEQFRKELGITMPIFMDVKPYPVSNAYAIHTVPSIFLMDSDKKILFTSYGFVKQEILNLADILAEKSGRPQIEVFGSVEVPEIQPG